MTEWSKMSKKPEDKQEVYLWVHNHFSSLYSRSGVLVYIAELDRYDDSGLPMYLGNDLLLEAVLWTPAFFPDDPVMREGEYV